MAKMTRAEAETLGEQDGEEHAESVYYDEIGSEERFGADVDAAEGAARKRLERAVAQGNWDVPAREASVAAARKIPESLREPYYEAYGKAAAARAASLLAEVSKE
jgi:hypothetical protein